MNTRDLIMEADRIAHGQGLTQAEWCRRAGFDQFGKMISNTVNRGDCKLSVFLQLLRSIGCELEISKMK